MRYADTHTSDSAFRHTHFSCTRYATAVPTQACPTNVGPPGGSRLPPVITAAERDTRSAALLEADVRRRPAGFGSPAPALYRRCRADPAVTSVQQPPRGSAAGKL